MPSIVPILLLAIAAMVTGCDPIFGVVWTARVSFMPEPEAVETAIRSASGIDRVGYHFAEKTGQ